MSKKIAVKLRNDDREKLNKLMRKGSEKARKFKRFQILLLSDEGKVDTGIAKVLKISVGTVANIRKRYHEGGLELALNDRRRPGAPRKFHERDRAKITALACSKPPEGHSQWSLRLLADKAVELDFVNEISHMEVHRILKKTNSSRI
jgi:putative transposase